MPLARLGSVDLHYLTLDRSGSGGCSYSDIILLHGLAANIGFWYLRIAPGLAGAHRVTMVDLRGHGRSSMPPTGYTSTDMAHDIHDLMQHIGVGAAHLVGHSFGGHVAMRVAALFPERVTSLVLADVRVRAVQPQADTTNWRRWGRYATSLAAVGEQSEQEGLEFGPSLVERIARMRVSGSGSTEDNLPPLFAGRTGRIAASRWLKLVENASARRELFEEHSASLAELRSINKPTLLVYGEYSQNMPSAVALAKLWRRARIHVVPRAGHFFPATIPAALVQAVLDFTRTMAEQDASQAVWDG